jgi:hypothetical protein
VPSRGRRLTASRSRSSAVVIIDTTIIIIVIVIAIAIIVIITIIIIIIVVVVVVVGVGAIVVVVAVVLVNIVVVVVVEITISRAANSAGIGIAILTAGGFTTRSGAIPMLALERTEHGSRVVTGAFKINRHDVAVVTIVSGTVIITPGITTIRNPTATTAVIVSAPAVV